MPYERFEIPMKLKLRHIEVFNALIEAGSVSRAAQRLNLTQPAVSIALSNLEENLGFRLFHREKGYFAPTGEAMELHEEVARGLLAFSRIEQRVEEIRTGATGGISIATNGALAFNFLPETVVAYQKANPGIAVELRVHSSRQIASWVSGRQIDIGLIDTPVPVAGLRAEVLQLECVCIMRQDDPLCELPVVGPHHLSGRSIITITGDHTVDRQLEKLTSETNTRISRNTSSYFFAIARNIVAKGDHIAIVDPINGKIELSDQVTWRPFAPAVYHELAVITSRDQPMALAVGGMHDLILRQLREVATKPQGPPRVPIGTFPV